MAHSQVELRNPTTNALKRAPIGYSWTTALFFIWPAVFRNDWKWFVIQFAAGFLIGVVTAGIALIPFFLVFAFFYNKLYLKDLINAGWTVEKVTSEMSVQQLEAELGFSLGNGVAKLTCPQS